MAIITVKSQKELDAIPANIGDVIKIDFGTYESPAVVRIKYDFAPELCKNRVARVHKNGTIIGNDHCHVYAYDYSSVESYGTCRVSAYGSSLVQAYYASSVEAREDSSIIAYGISSVEAYDSAQVQARDRSRIFGWGNSSILALEYSQVEAYDMSSVEAYEKSSVELFEDSSAKAYETSFIEVYDKNAVEAHGNVQVINYSSRANIKIFGNARIVSIPKSIEEFMNFYGIKHNKTDAIFYKAVHKRTKNDASFEYVSDFDTKFKYKIGGTICSKYFDDDPQMACGCGIHISNKKWALCYGRNWDDIAILEVNVKIEDILLPDVSNGKVRAPKVEVLREVPLEECGVLGEILKRKQARYILK